MWQQILDQLSPTLESPFELAEKRVLGGNDFCQLYQLRGRNGHPPIFIKLCLLDHLEQLESEAYNLELLTRASTIRLPKVYYCGTVRDKAFLALEYLPQLTTEASDNQWREFGHQLASLHRSGDQGMYGWDQDNFIGSTVQRNDWKKKWCAFFAEQRLGWQLQLAEENGMYFAPIEQLVEQAYRLLREHQPTPALLHGDLWRGNLGFSEHTPVIYDPACYYGDRETDLAMSELFTPLPRAFYDGYQAAWPLPPGYAQRKGLYNLYHLLNHANLFGGRYITQCEQAIGQLLL